MHFNEETEDALMNFEDDTENEIDEHNGLPYARKDLKDAYFL